MARLEPYVPKSHGKHWVDDRCVLIGIILINANILRWRDTPREYGPRKTLCNRWKIWRGVAKRLRVERGHEPGVVARIMAGLATEHGEETTAMIDATSSEGPSYGVQPQRQKGWRGRMIDRTKGGMNTKLHAIYDSQGRPIDFS